MNAIAIFLVIASFVGLVYYYISKDSKKTPAEETMMDEDTENEYTIDSLADLVSQYFTEQLRSRIEDEALTERGYKKKQKDMADLRSSLDGAPMGVATARTSLKNRIQTILTASEIGIALTERDIDKIIPFGKPESLTEAQIHEILIHLYSKTYGAKGFKQMVKEFKLDEPITIEKSDGTREEYRKIPKAEIRSVYSDVFSGKRRKRINREGKEEEYGTSLTNVRLTYNDKLEILSQLIFQSRYGLSVIDSLYHSELDEIDCGVSGIPVGGFDVAVAAGGDEVLYSYQSIWVVLGSNIQLEYLGFPSEEDYVRVNDNIYRYNAKRPLSQKEGAIVSTMPDGSRIEINRPPFSQNRAFFLRKFAAPSAVHPRALTQAYKNNWIPLTFMFWSMRGQKTAVLSGGTGTGKSTMIKALIRYIDTHFNLRIYEIAPELNLRYAYPLRNILELASTETIDMKAATEYGKKMNLDVSIIGEAADTVQVCRFLDTAKNNSKIGLTTQHSLTPDDMVESLAEAEVAEGLFKDKGPAVADVAKTVNINIGIANTKGYRHINYISEIVPYSSIEFPSESEAYANASEEDKTNADARKYYKDSINPKKYEINQLMHWTENEDAEGKPTMRFVLDNLPSEKFGKDIYNKLGDKEKARYDHDMEMLQKCWKNYEEGHDEINYDGESEEARWIEDILSR